MSERAAPQPFDLAAGVPLGGDELAVVAGPCVIESPERTFEAARAVAAMGQRLGRRLIFKASFDKANRSSVASFRGPGLSKGLEVLAEVKAETGLPLLTDVHEPHHCRAAAKVCDVLQVPAFLCRQTDLIQAAASTGRPVNIKKGQFMAPDDMRRAVEKARATGNRRVSVTERGVTFGYHNLVVDMRSFAMLHADGIPVLYDVTHSLQLPSAAGEETGGQRRFAEPLARAAVAAGADGVYLEVHPDPETALSDRATQLPPERAESLLAALFVLRRALGGVEAPA
ncbi:MAG: 3-deoxy-8-phosphooctulonate synthase [Thermoanaerobaculia bacterium]|nr:3-deoxy-8-phosphooctulonate synthase [Thermoanaerobaculia bacterium]